MLNTHLAKHEDNILGNNKIRNVCQAQSSNPKSEILNSKDWTLGWQQNY